MAFGELLFNARKAKGWTQTELAERMDVSPEAVSKWERNAYRPNDEKLEKLNELLGLPFFDEEGEPLNQPLFDETHMSAFLKGKMNSLGMEDAVRALDYAKEMHKNTEPLKGISKIPFISHPLTMACHAFALGLKDEELIAALLLHDVVEMCDVTAASLPFSTNVKWLVSLVTKPNRPYDKKEFYDAIAADPRACLVKCMERCNNISNMASGFSSAKIAEYVADTEQYYPQLLRSIKGVSKYNNAAWLLEYQIKALLATAKRIH